MSGPPSGVANGRPSSARIGTLTMRKMVVCTRLLAGRFVAWDMTFPL